MNSGDKNPKMMGKTHALTGVAGAIGVTYLVTVSVPAAVIGTFMCGGAALLPDIDHNESTITKTFGPITKILSKIVQFISGGHRLLTHSIPGIVGLGWVANLAVHSRDEIWAQITLSILMILCFAGPIRLIGIPGWFDDLAPIPIVIGIVCFTRVPLNIVPPVLVLGCAIHVAGDMITKSGCPILFPFSLKRYKLAQFTFRHPLTRKKMTIGGLTTGGKVETMLIRPAVVLSIVIGILWKLVDSII